MSTFTAFADSMDSQEDNTNPSYYEGIDAVWEYHYDHKQVPVNPYHIDDKNWKWFEKGMNDGLKQIETARAFSGLV